MNNFLSKVKIQEIDGFGEAVYCVTENLYNSLGCGSMYVTKFLIQQIPSCFEMFAAMGLNRYLVFCVAPVVFFKLAAPLLTPGNFSFFMKEVSRNCQYLSQRAYYAFKIAHPRILTTRQEAALRLAGERIERNKILSENFKKTGCQIKGDVVQGNRFLNAPFMSVLGSLGSTFIVGGLTNWFQMKAGIAGAGVGSSANSEAIKGGVKIASSVTESTTFRTQISAALTAGAGSLGSLMVVYAPTKIKKITGLVSGAFKYTKN